MATITIIGTSHVSRDSIHQINEFVEKNKVDIIAIELDSERLASLLSRKRGTPKIKDIFSMGIPGFLFFTLGYYLQKRIGKKLNIIPGSDMISAFNIARKKNIQVALIDQNIRVTIRNFSKSFKIKYVFKMIGSIFYGLLFPKKQMKKFNFKNFDIAKIPSQELVDKAMLFLKKDYYGIYKALVEDRNNVMVNNLIKLARNFPEKNILAVVGKGHVKEMREILEKRIKNLQKIFSSPIDIQEDFL